MNKFNFAAVPVATWVRIIGLFIILANQVSISIFKFQLLPFADEEIYEGVSTVLTLLMSVYAGWKNNSVTERAQYADNIMKGDK